MAESTSKPKQPSVLDSKYPVLFPAHPAFTLPESKFLEFLKQDLAQQRVKETSGATPSAKTPSTLGALKKEFKDLKVDDKKDAKNATTTNRFSVLDDLETENLMLTENADVAYRSTNNPLVDLFYELEETAAPSVLEELLPAAWKEDALATLKMIFNLRSIHIGKASREAFYRCASWLATEHPLTLLVNLQWLSRPTIEKKMAKKEEDEDAPVLVEAEKDENDPSRFDVQNGVAHGYYKDLLNILAVAANGQLDLNGDLRHILNFHDKKSESERVWDKEKAKTIRHAEYNKHHIAVVKKFEEDAIYRLLHITVARIFAAQLIEDLALLRSTDPKAKRRISLCAKWAPSHKLFHDKQTFVVSSIAEILHPQTEFKGISDRETYLRHAREAYRKDVAALRKALEIVERDISKENFKDIKYEKVPSLAMSRYSPLFAKKDFDHFDKYIENVVQGKQKISGAVLLPSKLIHTARTVPYSGELEPTSRTAKAMIDAKMANINAKVIDGQWKTLVQRIRDSGSISSSIAVCDVSGSMNYPVFPDGTVPMDSAIGLSLLVAEITAPPFGGKFITFSSNPQLQEIDLSKTLNEKVHDMSSADWGMSTDFAAVFESLILPEARRHELKPEDMVKRVFVFSDMQFNAADPATASRNYLDHVRPRSNSTGALPEPTAWDSSYQRIKRSFKKYGYEMPELVFWNLAGGRAGYPGAVGGDPTAPKPVTSNEIGTSLVSGYSQGMLKVFLDNGGFEDPEEAVEEEITEVEGEDDENGFDEVVISKRKKVKTDPMITVKKAISHKSYDMLTVVD